MSAAPASTIFFTLRNGGAAPISSLRPHPWEAVVHELRDRIARGRRVAAMFALPAEAAATGESGAPLPEIVFVLADDAGGRLEAARATLHEPAFDSLTLEFPQVHLFEREIQKQYGIVARGHPWMKPVRFQQPLPGAVAGVRPPQIGVAPFYSIEGAEIHEVGVGPVHAGVIEPGHFRFQCHGETVFHLEISLGYQHRGIERALLGGPHPRSPHLIETLAGDTTIGHTWAYCMVCEGLGGAEPTQHADTLRAIALELERLANHTGDLGALAGDVGFLPTLSFCGRIRGDFLNMTALLCGNRFGRNYLRPGGVRFELPAPTRAELSRRLALARRDITGAAELLWHVPSVMARMERTGTVSREDAESLGLVGPAARASNVKRDVRRDHALGPYERYKIAEAFDPDGDVAGRTSVRWQEIRHSLGFIEHELEWLADSSPSSHPPRDLSPNEILVALVEGWRGECCHVAITGAGGRFRRYKVVDPSFHNWTGLAMALRDQQISDFPLCNKSFNLSYCGYDL